MVPFRPLGLDHVVFRVENIERSIRFYCDVIGCVPEREAPELGLFQFRAGAQLIDLVPVDSPLGRAAGGPPQREAVNVDHVALAIDRFDEVDLRAHLEANGVGVGEVASRYGAKGQGPSMYIRDPDGNVIELKGPPSGGSS